MDLAVATGGIGWPSVAPPQTTITDRDGLSTVTGGQNSGATRPGLQDFRLLTAGASGYRALMVPT
jgi:hypothetical protein